MTGHDPQAPAGSQPMRERRWADADGEHVDVRGLSPPQPLVAIVQLIESIDDTRAVVAHLDRDPMMLYPELAERGWMAQRVPAPPGEVRLRLMRDAANPDSRGLR